MLNEQEQQALAAIAERNGGVILPQAVVEAARAKESPLHKHFTWNVRKAAEERWLDQASQLIRKFKVEITVRNFEVKVPAFVRDPKDRVHRRYVSLGRLQSDEEHAREVVIAEFSRAAEAVKRAKNLAAVLGMETEIEVLQNQIDKLIAFVESPKRVENDRKRPRRSH